MSAHSDQGIINRSLSPKTRRLASQGHNVPRFTSVNRLACLSLYSTKSDTSGLVLNQCMRVIRSNMSFIGCYSCVGLGFITESLCHSRTWNMCFRYYKSATHVGIDVEPVFEYFADNAEFSYFPRMCLSTVNQLRQTTKNSDSICTILCISSFK